MSTITTRFLVGGAGLTPKGAGSPTVTDALRELADDLAVLGLIAHTPTSASTQQAGTGATDWNIDITPGEVQIDGDYAAFSTQADYNVHTGSMLPAANQSVYARLVAKNVSNTVTLAVVTGTPATTGSEAIPTDAAVQAAVGAGNPWCDIALLHLTRDGTTGLTQTQNNGYRTKTLKG